MAQRDCASVDVGALAIQSHLPLNGKVLRGEGLINLDQVDVRQPQTGSLKRLFGGRYWSDSHYVGCNSRNTPGDDSAERLSLHSPSRVFGGDHERCLAVNTA